MELAAHSVGAVEEPEEDEEHRVDGAGGADGGNAQQQLKNRFMAKLNEPRGDKLSSINRVDIK